MGCIHTRIREDENKQINDIMKRQRQQDNNTIRILLVGSCGSGTTTILKQLRRIQHSKTHSIYQINLLINGYIRNIEQQYFNNNKLIIIPTSINKLCSNYYDIYNMNKDILSEVPYIEGYTSYIKERVVIYTKILCRYAIQQNIQLSPNVDNSKNFMQNLETPFPLSSEIADHIKMLWNDDKIKEIQQTSMQTSLHSGSCNMKYFFDNRLNDICQDNYKPTFEDYIKIRMRTTGFSEELFENKFGDNYDTKCKIKVTDLGGARAERQKWFSMRKESINGIIFVASLDEYCCPCFEDSSTLRLQESLNLFRQVLNRGFFTNKYVLLLFNKYDSLLNKLSNDKIPTIEKYFNNFPVDKDPKNPNDIIQFTYSMFTNLYKKEIGNIENMPRYKVVSGVDTAAVDMIFGAFISKITNRPGFKSTKPNFDPQLV